MVRVCNHRLASNSSEFNRFNRETRKQTFSPQSGLIHNFLELAFDLEREEERRGEDGRVVWWGVAGQSLDTKGTYLRRIEVNEHLLNTLLDLGLRGNTGGVDVVDTRADVPRVSFFGEDLQQLGVRFAVLNGQDISIEGSDGVEEVLEFGITEVRVHLRSVSNTGGGQLESRNGPLDVSLAGRAGAQRKTLTQSRLIDLNDLHTSGLEVDNLITQSQSKLLSLHALVNIVTGERPPQASDGTSKHALHGLLGDRDSVLALLHSHGGRTADITDNNGRADTTRAIRLHPGKLGERIFWKLA